MRKITLPCIILYTITEKGRSNMDKKLEDMTKDEIIRALYDSFDFIDEDMRMDMVENTIISMIQ